uniref:tRNA (adenine(58)-N(1))-methyltransferase non-catalytic subunit TRM6 n=1 Tax=Percolomonas cosmopolitus TaxID=63605 RepID=A0A7S1KPP0_9EUKA|mmetsp:Transcript_4164/g.15708  ORF Transcript_4164/g.15708 Transcript_4164/m.15708 type:complete len:439 (+) Transcript_4164:3-1319(+)
MSSSPSTFASNTIQKFQSICLVFGPISNDSTKLVISKPEKSIGKMKGRRAIPLNTLIGQEFDYWYEYKMSENKWVQMDHFPYANKEHDDEGASASMDDEDLANEVNNATIADDNQAQALSATEITKLRDETTSSSELIQKIAANSNTFQKKTKFSKEKYMRKKKQKYDLYAFVQRPTMDLIARTSFMKKASKIAYLRWDTLAQLIYNAAIKSGSNVMVLSTCHGLVPAALFDRFRDDIRLYRLFPDSRSIHANMNCIEHLHSYQPHKYVADEDELHKQNPDVKYVFPQDLKRNTVFHMPMGYFDATMKDKHLPFDYYPPLIKQFEDETIDCMIIATDEYNVEEWFPKMYAKLTKGGNFAVYSRFMKPLESLFWRLREVATCVEMYETWWRDYQVLKNRTHPKMVMNNCSGYVCHGVKIEEWDANVANFGLDDEDEMQD